MEPIKEEPEEEEKEELELEDSRHEDEFLSLNCHFYWHCVQCSCSGWPTAKWKETKQQPSMLPGPAVPGCCSVSFHILWAILSTSTALYTIRN